MSYNMLPNAWIYIYLSQLLILSLGLGCLALYQPRMFAINPLSRFLIGFCTTPYIIGIWMMLAAFIMPSGPRWLFVLVPLIIAFYILVIYTPRIYQRIKRKSHKGYRFNKQFLPILVIYFCAILLLAISTSKIYINSIAEIKSHDALTYLTKALYFAEDRTVTSTVNYLDSPDGSYRGDSHNFVFSAYLSHALLQTDANTLGYPNDLAVRWAFQITFFYMLLSILALAKTFNTVGIGALSLILLLLVPQLEYISYGSSRDAFRVIPIILITIILASLSPQKIDKKIRPLNLIPLLILSTFSLMGHTLGGIIIIILVLTWIFWVEWWKKSHRYNIILVNAAIIIGLMIGSIHFVDKYLKTNSILGESTGKKALKGTPIEFAINPSTPDDREYSINASKIERLLLTLQLDQGKLSVPGLIGGGVSILLVGRLKRKNKYIHLPFIGAIIFTMILPYSGLMDFEDYSLSRAFSSNIRYSLHWYPFLAICASALTLYCYNWLLGFGKGWLTATSKWLLTILTVTVTYSAINIVNTEWRVHSQATNENFILSINEFKKVLDTMPIDKRIFMNDGRYSYYLGRQVMTRFAVATWPITRAKDESEVSQALSDLNVGAIMLNTKEILGWWDQLPLYSYLNNAPNIGLILSNSDAQVHRIIENELERTKIIIACISQQGCNIPADSLYLLASRLHPVYGSKGFTYAQSGDWEKLSELFEEATNIYNNDLSLHLTLAKAYQMQGRSEELFSCYKQILNLTQSSKEVIEFLANEVRISPDNLISYLSEGESYHSTTSSDVAYTFLDELNNAKKESINNSIYIRRSSFIVEGLPLGVIYQHAPAEVAYELTIPPNGELVFSIALAPGTWSLGNGDGVQFDIYLNSKNINHNIFSQYIDPKNIPSHRGWFEQELDLTMWANQDVTIIFATEPGPNDDSRYDWAGWGEPRIVQPVAYDFLSEFDNATQDGAEGQVRQDTLEINGEQRSIIFQHPTNRLVYQPDLPEQSRLAFGLGVDPEVWSPDKGDGVDYKIYVRMPDEPDKLYRVFQRYIDPKNNPDDRRWFDERVDLSRFGGQTVDIIFETTPGPDGNANYDWGGWSTPVLIDETPGQTLHTAGNSIPN